MAGSLNSSILGGKTLNAGAQRVPISAIMNIQITSFNNKAAKLNTVTANIAFNLDIDGASSRHTATADIELAFEGAFAVSKLKAAEPEDMSLLFDMASNANKCGVIEANLPIDCAIKDKMQFSHLRRAPYTRVMIVETEVRSSTIAKEQQ